MTVSAFLVVGSLLFGCAMLVIGAVAGLWMAQRNNAISDVETTSDGAQILTGVDTERAQLISGYLIRLAQKVSGDVSAHSTKIEAVSADLRGVDDCLAAATARIRTAPERILAANLELQQQLASAKHQIEFQAAQLRARESEARTDLLTMLFNRRAFEEELGRQLSLWERKETPFAVLMLDIDHFKRVNDTYGHQVGDDVLREVAQVIFGQLRDMDMACRYGGEEFAVILPATNANDACIVAERIRKAIDRSIISCPERELTVTTSIGVAHALASDQFAKLIRRADEALYGAKQSGRNCIRWHNGTEIVSTELGARAAADEKSTVRTMHTAKSITLSALNRELTARVCESRRCHTPLSLICVRVDRNIKTNDSLSRATSSRALQAVIDSILPSLQEPDLLVPMGVAEVVVVLPGQSQIAAMELIEEVLGSATIDSIDGLRSSQLQFDACELLPNETAEQLLIRARESALMSRSSV